MNREVAISESKALAVATRDGILVPRVIGAADDKAARRFLEFFAATIRHCSRGHSGRCRRRRSLVSTFGMLPGLLRGGMIQSCQSPIFCGRSKLWSWDAPIGRTPPYGRRRWNARNRKAVVASPRMFTMQHFQVLV
jgi:hypothetical protein